MMDIDLEDQLRGDIDDLHFETEELRVELRELVDEVGSLVSSLYEVKRSLEDRIQQFEMSHMGLQLSATLHENDRLKRKCNKLNSLLGGKYIDE